MGELILILGGARSGKSAQALRIAQERGNDKALFVATAEAGDDEMRLRIAKHRAERPAHWRTLEAPRNVGLAVSQHARAHATIIVDCITLLVSNLLDDRPDPYDEAVQEDVGQEVAAILRAVREMPDGNRLILVSNEVGAGLAPLTPLGRAFRDLVGRANQTFAEAADRVVLMVAGLALTLKQDGTGPPAFPQSLPDANRPKVLDE